MTPNYQCVRITIDQYVFSNSGKQYNFFQIRSNFWSAATFAFLGSKIQFRFLQLFQPFLFNLKREENCQAFVEKFIKIQHTIPEIVYLEMKKFLKFLSLFFLLNLNLSMKKQTTKLNRCNFEQTRKISTSFPFRVKINIEFFQRK